MIIDLPEKTKETMVENLSGRHKAEKNKIRSRAFKLFKNGGNIFHIGYMAYFISVVCASARPEPHAKTKQTTRVCNVGSLRDLLILHESLCIWVLVQNTTDNMIMIQDFEKITFLNFFLNLWNISTLLTLLDNCILCKSL